MTMPDVDTIIAYEQGELDVAGTLTLFANLIATGTCWSLQGHYGRTASALINNHLITPEGEVTQIGLDLIARDDD